MIDMPPHDQSGLPGSAESLSAAGRSRRRDILVLASGQMVAHHRRRRRRRWVAAAAVMTLTTAGLVIAGSRHINAGPPPANPPTVLADGTENPVAEHSADDRPAAVDVRIVRTDTTISSRFAVQTTTAAQRVDDAELLALLRAAHRPAGLIRVDGRIMLTSNVIDMEEDNDGPQHEPGPSM